MAKTRILFLCTGNSIRSQIAEGLFRSMAGEQFEVVSAGVAPAGIHPMTYEVMREDGVDISGQYSKSVEEFDLSSLDWVITLCGHAKEVCPPIPKKVQQLHWPIFDPIDALGTPEQRRERFREAREEIRGKIGYFLKSLRTT